MEEFEKVAQRFLDYYKSYFKDDKDLVIIEKCEMFIKNYFKDLYKKIYDMSETTILSLSERDTQIVRTRFGVYDNGECQIYPTIIERFGYKCPRSIFDKFERKIFDDLEKKIKEFLIIIEQPDEQFKDGVNVGRDEDRLLNPKRLDILRQLFEKRNELVECQRVLAEMKDQIASLMLELHSLEKIERMKKLEIEQLESELRNHDNQFKKTYF